MQISLNGKTHTLKEAVTLEQLTMEFCKNNKHLIIELNGTIVKSQFWPQTIIKDGDCLELISIVGGG